MSKADLSNVAVEILLTLANGPLYGYAIKLDVERRIGGNYILGSGSLYQAIQRLERREFIAETRRKVADDNRRGRVYQIRPAGRRALEADVERMERVVRQVRGGRLAVDGGAR